MASKISFKLFDGVKIEGTIIKIISDRECKIDGVKINKIDEKMFMIDGVMVEKISNNEYIVGRELGYDIKITASIIDSYSIIQIVGLTKVPELKGVVIRIMPDVHAGAGCVCGLTMNLNGVDYIIPSLIGVDIGCGMSFARLTQKIFTAEDLKRIDDAAHKVVPTGFNIHTEVKDYFDLTKFYCFTECSDEMKKNFLRSIGTLGGGNHFISIEVGDTSKNPYLIVHTGSRSLGRHIALYYQKIAFEKYKLRMQEEYENKRREIKERLHAEGRDRFINDELKKIHKMSSEELKKMKDLCGLSGEDARHYLHDMMLAQEYATLNRKRIIENLTSSLSLSFEDYNETIHNYISPRDMILRKSSISAYEDEIVLIPNDQCSGSHLCIGLSNKDENFSAPHGSGRAMSRGEAKKTFDGETEQKKMLEKGVYTTTTAGNVDECTGAYKNASQVMKDCEGFVKIIEHLTPIWNFKDCSAEAASMEI